MMLPTTMPSASTSKSSSFHSSDRREAAARLRTNWSMSALLLPGYAESGYTEPKEDRTQNKVIQNPGDACAEHRQEGEQSEVARLGVHVPLPIRKGQRPGCPLFCARVDGLEPPDTTPRGRTAGHLSGSDRTTRCPTEGNPPRGDASRPRLRGAVNELVKYAYIDVR